ncbi:hypothetical protein EVAR_73638_1 [Eumeta japonica]|uniref:Uncharacterized protein n=1 Tax=Eumeta variegata TaxID=151549 RepID=A0A4C1SPN5_EUMVA|nr:hypothetical protein EVAR_73638_1 [Eumeta japonica]
MNNWQVYNQKLICTNLLKARRVIPFKTQKYVGRPRPIRVRAYCQVTHPASDKKFHVFQREARQQKEYYPDRRSLHYRTPAASSKDRAQVKVAVAIGYRLQDALDYDCPTTKTRSSSGNVEASLELERAVGTIRSTFYSANHSNRKFDNSGVHRGETAKAETDEVEKRAFPTSATSTAICRPTDGPAYSYSPETATGTSGTNDDNSSATFRTTTDPGTTTSDDAVPKGVADSSATTRCATGHSQFHCPICGPQPVNSIPFGHWNHTLGCKQLEEFSASNYSWPGPNYSAALSTTPRPQRTLADLQLIYWNAGGISVKNTGPTYACTAVGHTHYPPGRDQTLAKTRTLAAQFLCVLSRRGLTPKNAYRGIAVLVRRDVVHGGLEQPDFTVTRTIGVRVGAVTAPVCGLRLRGFNFCSSDIHIIFDGNIPTIQAGDLNLKHSAWGSRIVSLASRQLLQDSEDYGYEGIEPDTPSHVPTDPGSRADVLDVMLCHQLPYPIHVKMLYDMDT